MNKTRTIGIGIAIFLVCMLLFHLIAHEFFYLPFGLCLLISLIITALVLFFLHLHHRIFHLENQVEYLTKLVYQQEKLR